MASTRGCVCCVASPISSPTVRIEAHGSAAASPAPTPPPRPRAFPRRRFTDDMSDVYSDAEDDDDNNDAALIDALIARCAAQLTPPLPPRPVATICALAAQDGTADDGGDTVSSSEAMAQLPVTRRLSHSRFVQLFRVRATSTTSSEEKIGAEN